jgi:hypothetical protein
VKEKPGANRAGDGSQENKKQSHAGERGARRGRVKGRKTQVCKAPVLPKISPGAEGKA